VPSIEDETTDEAQSPRSAAAYRFKNLRIAGNGGVTRPDWLSAAQLDGSLDGNAARKRTKFILDGVEEIPETPQISFATDLNFNRAAYARPDESPVGNRGDPIVFRGSDSNPTNSRTSGKRRSSRSTPPRNTRTPSPDVVNQQDLSPPPSSPLVPETPPSPEFTSLHWDDSEITGHNPSDPEDDGEGINGLGFKPTAAIARSRSERRRKQMAEYKSREAREAREVRAKRIQQRRREKAGELAAAAEQKDAAEKKQRVRFLEAEKAVGVL
jgi:hypothetical protein